VRTGVRGRTGAMEAVEVLEGLAPGARVLAGSVGTVTEGTRWRLTTAAAKPAPAASTPR